MRTATQDDLKHFFGDKMRKTIRAWSAYRDGELLGIGGVVLQRHNIIAFSVIADDAEVSSREIWETAKDMMEKIKRLQYPVMYAVADNNQDSAPRFLKRLGFKKEAKGQMGDIYKWQIR